MPGAASAPRARDAVLVALAALALRAVVVAYAAGRFPPADDGVFYDVVAARIARGLGYTWAWPDGAVTYAAHYPVGYPALVAVAYRVAGAHPGVAMTLNAVVGAVAAAAAYVLAGRSSSRLGAVCAGSWLALEPALLLYTPALMTEAVAGELVVIAAAVVSAGSERALLRTFVAGVLMGVAVLVRPQLLLVAPCVGAAAAWRRPEPRRVWVGAVAVSAVAFALCVPWTLRNCARLDRCAFVSANGGWNLFIGSSPLGEGGWAPVERIGVPAECRNVFGEGEKDRCFGQAGARAIRRQPLRWLALAPKKLGVTFDYGTAAAHYLAASNPSLVDEPRKFALGAAELFGQRLLLLTALLAAGVAAGPRDRARALLTPLAAVFALAPFAWIAWLLLGVLCLLHGRELFRRPSVLLALGVVSTTAVVHAVFFGAGRYALVCLPAVASMSGSLWQRTNASGARPD